MPFPVIYTDSKNNAGGVWDNCLSSLSTSTYFAAAGMGEFVFTPKPLLDTTAAFMFTCGAATCTIMLVHMDTGIGALGHYYATGKESNEINGLCKMIEALQKVAKSPPASVLVAAGNIGENVGEFGGKIVSGVKSRYSEIGTCLYVGSSYSGCIYQPQKRYAAFFDNNSELKHHRAPSVVSFNSTRDEVFCLSAYDEAVYDN